MANLARWNPVSEFEDLLDRYNRYFGLTRPGTAGETENRDLLSRADWAPAVDIRENQESFQIDAELPGMSKDDIKVTVQDGVLTIQGERRREEEVGEGKQHRIERVYGNFLRRFTLPQNVDEDSVRARFKDGVLSLTVNKSEKAQPKAIEVDVQ